MGHRPGQVRGRRGRLGPRVGRARPRGPRAAGTAASGPRLSGWLRVTRRQTRWWRPLGTEPTLPGREPSPPGPGRQWLACSWGAREPGAPWSGQGVGRGLSSRERRTRGCWGPGPHVAFRFLSQGSRCAALPSSSQDTRASRVSRVTSDGRLNPARTGVGTGFAQQCGRPVWGSHLRDQTPGVRLADETPGTRYWTFTPRLPADWGSQGCARASVHSPPPGFLAGELRNSALVVCGGE